LAAAYIHEKADLLEREKRDAERQDDRSDKDACAQQKVDVAREKAGVFEDADGEQVYSDPERKKQACSLLPLQLATLPDRLASRVIYENRADEQRQETDVPVRIEEERGGQQRQLLRSAPEPVKTPRDNDRYGKEEKQEGKRVKKHCPARLLWRDSCQLPSEPVAACPHVIACRIY